MAATPGWAYWAVARATVAPEAATNLTLTAAPLPTMTGRVIFESARKASLSSPSVRLTVTSPVDWDDECRAATEISIRPDGTFSHKDVAGRCVIRADAGDWTIKTILIGKTDVTDRPIQFRPGRDVQDVQIVMTDRVTELVPEVTDARGAATDDYVLLAFSDDPEKRGEQSRFVRMFSPSFFQSATHTDSGRVHGLRALPPGSYHVVALEDLSYDDVYDPRFFDALTPDTASVVLAEGERRGIQLRRIQFLRERLR